MVLDMAADGVSSVKMVVSYGGEIIMDTTTGNKAARYAGGENRIVRVGLSERLSELRARLSALAGYSDVRIRYAVAGGPGGGDGLDALHDVEDEHDLWVLVTRLCCCTGLASRDGRVRAFLFPIVSARTDGNGNGIPRPASSPSLLESTSSSKQGATTLTLPRAQSAMALSPCTPPAAHADSGFEALAEIAAAQRSASSSVTSSSSTQALATVAVSGQQRVQQVLPSHATAHVVLFLAVPVAPVAVFLHAIPVLYGCLIPAVLS